MTHSAASVTSTPDTRSQSSPVPSTPQRESSTPQYTSLPPQRMPPQSRDEDRSQRASLESQRTSPMGRAGIPSNHTVCTNVDQQELGAGILSGMQSTSFFVAKRLLT